MTNSTKKILVKTNRSIFFFVTVLLCSAPSKAEERVLVAAKINGQSVSLAFDTGFGGTFAIWRSFADQLGLKITPAVHDGKLGPGEIELGLTEPAKVLILGKSLDQVRLFVLEEPSNLPFQGLIGWTALKDNILRVDVAEHTVTLVNNVPSESTKCLPLRMLPKEGAGLTLTIAEEQGVTSTVAIDTGSSAGVMLSSAEWKRWRTANPHQPITLNAYYSPADGLIVKEESWADNLSLGPIVLHDVPVMEANPASISGGGSGYLATLGLASVGRLDLVIDGHANTVYVHSRTDPPLPYDHNRLGAVFPPASEVNDALVARVAEGSPATIAGIHNGDILLKIDQLDVTKWRTQPDILPFSRFWNQSAGTKLALTLSRGEATLQLAATLIDILGSKSLLVGNASASALAQPSLYSTVGLEIYNEAKNEDLTAAVLKQVPLFRKEVIRKISASSMPAVLIDSYTEKKLCDLLTECLGLASDSNILTRYDQSLRTNPPDRLVSRFAIKRVYLYDRKQTTERLQAGGTIPYIVYEPQSHRLINDPLRFSFASGPEPPADYPIVIVFPGHDKSPKELVADEITSTRAAFQEAFNRQNARAAFDIVDTVVSKTLASELPETPAWFSIGLSDYLDLLLLATALEDGHKALDCVAKARLIVTKPKARTNLADWDPSHFDTGNNNFFRNQSSLLFLTIHEGVGKNHDWVKDVVMKLKMRVATTSSQQPLDSKEICKIIQETTGVNVTPLLQTVYAP